jgi:crotonobetainyl-CoA:carnitine CoA-transferase CaiB-like acyl-CoA transferase
LPVTARGGGPLAGLRVIAIEQYGAGPYGTLYLADMGAEVIKIEDPGTGGDISRYVPPGQQGQDSLFFETFNRGKKSICLDLKNPAGRQVLERLVKDSQGIFTNLRGDLPERLGLTYEHLGAINPALVCVSLSAYGRTGPRSAYPGYDALIQADAGWAALTGEPNGPPVKSGLSLVDYSAGLMAALGLMIGVFQAQRTGRGGNVDTSLYDVALALLTYPATWYLSRGIETGRLPLSAHPSMVPFQFFQTADGYIAVACPKEKFFRELIRAIDLPPDDRFSSYEARRQNRKALVELLTARLRERPTQAWIQVLAGRVPVAPVRSMTSALDETELEEQDMLVSYSHPTLGTVRMVGTPFKLEGYAPEYRAGPRMDGDRVAVLESLGYRPEEMDALAAAGAFGSPAMPTG